MDKSDEFNYRGLCSLVALFAASPFGLYAAHEIFVHGYLSALATANQKVYSLVVVALLGAMSVTSLLAGLETLRGDVRQPYRWATGAIILVLFAVSFFHPAGPGP